MARPVEILEDWEARAGLAAGLLTPMRDLGSTPVRLEVIRELRLRMLERRAAKRERERVRATARRTR